LLVNNFNKGRAFEEIGITNKTIYNTINVIQIRFHKTQ